MSYASETDFVAAYGQIEADRLADRDGDGTPDAGVLARALADASAEIDARLTVRYTVPVAPPPPALRRICNDIARYRLYDKQPHLEAHKPEWRIRYEDALRDLSAIADGLMALLDEDGVPIAPAFGGGRASGLARRLAFGAAQAARYDRGALEGVA